MKLKTGIFLMAVIFCSLALSGCGKDSITVNIYDCRVKTRLVAKPGQKVRDLLEEAEIPVGDKDVVTPAFDEKVTDNQAEIRIERHADVVVETEQGEIPVGLTGGKVQDALDKAGVVLLKNDYVNHNTAAYLTEGMRISVVHRMAVTLVADGKTEDCLTQAHTVQELLNEQKLTLGKLDRISPKVSAELSDGAKVVVKRVEIREVTEEEPIGFETKVTYSGSMPVGTRQLLREGVNGEKRVTYQVTYVDGKEESRKAIREEILKEAVAAQIVEGSKPKRTVASKQRVEDCDGSGHGYYIITYSDGTVEYQDF